MSSCFNWYPNTVSYANHTFIGTLPLYGGYEYTPQAINERSNSTLLEKQKQAYLLLPTLFADDGYKVTVTYPPFYNYRMSNQSIFSVDKSIDAKNITGKWTTQWLK